MWSRMSLDFMRKCNIFPIPDQVRDDTLRTIEQLVDEDSVRRMMWSTMSLDFMWKCNIFPYSRAGKR